MVDRYDKSFTRKPVGSEPAAQRPVPQDDPLVELARIVSGNQSFDDLVGRPAAQPTVATRPASAQRAPVRDTSFDLESELLNDLQSSFDPASRPSSPRASAPEPRQEPRQEPRAAQAAAPRESFDHMRLRPGQPQTPSWTAPREPEAEEDPYSGTAYAAGDFDRETDPFAAPRASTRAPAAPPPQPAAADHDDYYYEDEPAEPGYDDTDYGEDRFGEYDGYDAEPPRRSRRPLIIAAIGLAVVLAGGLAALALKGGSSDTSADAPKVIVADQGPTKVQPAAQPAADDGQQNKLIFDRANPDAAPQEQLVLPDDGAVDAPSSNESAASREISRIILPGAPGDNSSAPATPDASGAAPASDAQGGDDAVPRKVRTVVIKPDGTIVSSQATAKDAAPGSADVAAAPATTLAAPAASDAAPAADTAPAAAEPVAPEPAAPEPAVTAPLPAAEPSAPPSSKDTSQMAAPKPALRPAPAETVPAATSASGAGGFVVQVTSQRSQDQAATAYRALQRKYPEILGNRSPDIVRADLGAKGIYYRARVGPMATRDEAITLCEALKASGGACIVQKN
ncbi:hypothetical protein C3941_12340 [Kaistia algarum]|uniref:SPOR domain-containing protein n=1 Tax=Kaistia algarum TaxID=2083279 RepID=UPI000CE8EE1B|nr:SPOR domain-containing protein [Kaistia algarum]MCX5515138.1 SPOR domain-containing protein [Kaistia algarum]PPE79862.1 hypothetical protein C3941_12340 [Kaistia algarum]